MLYNMEEGILEIDIDIKRLQAEGRVGIGDYSEGYIGDCAGEGMHTCNRRGET